MPPSAIAATATGTVNDAAMSTCEKPEAVRLQARPAVALSMVMALPAAVSNFRRCT